MNIQTNYITPNFQARIKLKAPNKEILTRSVMGTTVLGTAAASLAQGVISGMQVEGGGPESVVNTLQNMDSETLKDMLYSQKQILLNDNNGRGIPIQSTIFPLASISSGVYSAYAGSNHMTVASQKSSGFTNDAQQGVDSDKKLPS